MADNIVKLADLQDAGELPPGTEDALALIYAERHVVDSRFVAAWSRWLLYDGARWMFDTTLHAFDRARAICREIAPESVKPAAVMTAKTVSAVVQLARGVIQESQPIEAPAGFARRCGCFQRGRGRLDGLGQIALLVQRHRLAIERLPTVFLR